MVKWRKIKLLTLNILSGGGKRIDKISFKIEKHDPDVLIISEFRLGKSWICFRKNFAKWDFLF